MKPAATTIRPVLGLVVAPVVAIAIGLWAEFAELTPPILFTVSIPVITVSALSLAYLAQQRIPMALALVLPGAVVGVVTFGLAEGTHVLLAVARGSELEFGDYQSRAAIATGLIVVHLAAGAMVGAGVGVALAVLYAANAWVVRMLSRGSSDLTPSPFPFGKLRAGSKGKGNPPAVQ